MSEKGEKNQKNGSWELGVWETCSSQEMRQGFRGGQEEIGGGRKMVSFASLASERQREEASATD
jgi:hypothetical protein